MKINKGINVLLASILIGSMLVGCNNDNDNDITKPLTKKVEVNEDKKEGKSPPKDNNKNSSKNIPKSIKEKSKAKETTTVEPYKCKYCSDTIYYIIEDKEHGINGDICWACYWNELMTIDDNNDNEEVEKPSNIPNDEPNNDEIDECSICGSHVGGREMCECDGTIHHRTCHIDAYTCPSCGRYGLNHDPNIYGCPYCGYPNEDYDDDDYEEPIEEPSDCEEADNYELEDNYEEPSDY